MKSDVINKLLKSLDYSYFDKSKFAQNSEAIDFTNYLIAKGYSQQNILYLTSEIIVYAKSKLPTS